jgi:membrane protein
MSFAKLLRYCWLFPWFIGRRFLAVRGIERSSSLAYVTLLSLVPMLATVAALYRSFFSLHTERLVELITLVLPYSTEEVYETLNNFVSRATTVGGIGSLVFLAIAFQLYLSIETTLNDVWSVTSKRTPAIRMFSFTMVVFWGPVVIGIGTTSLFWLEHQPWAPSSMLLLEVGRIVLPLIGLTMVYWLAPHTGVSIGSAFVGGLTATVGFYGLRTGFRFYLEHFGDINLIYGSLALVVIFLVSLFAFWTLVIVGAVTSYVAQNLGALVKDHYGENRDTDPTVTALAFLTECFRRRDQGEEPPNLSEIEATLGITLPAARKAADHLLATGLVAVTGRHRSRYLPGAESGSLTLAQAVEQLADSEPPVPGRGPSFTELGDKLADATVCRSEALAETTFADLLASEAGQQSETRADRSGEPPRTDQEPDEPTA